VALGSRYLLKDEHGKCIEGPGWLLSRLAGLVAKGGVATVLDDVAQSG